MMRQSKHLTALRLLIALLLAAALSACSPESERARGGGLGGDPYNRDGETQIHEGARPYYDTPQRLQSEWTMDNVVRPPGAEGSESGQIGGQ